MINRVLAGVFVTLLAFAVLGGVGAQTPPAPSTPAQSVGQAKIDALVASMTLDEKLSMLYGTQDPKSYGQAGYLAGVPRLGIPAMRLSDGPAGIRTSQPATALPAPVALASTFSPQLAKQYGQILGRDARARYQNVVLAPMVNIVRVPQAGRNFETLGEDPLLAGRLVAPEIEGIQGEGSIATVKHYAFNNQENARMSVSADLDERTMHEIYLPGFEAAIRAGVGSVMASYNRINGTYASENPLVLNDILREQLGFKGFVMSDWGATHSAVPALRAGMEMEMPSGRNFSSLRAAVDRGELNMPVVDEAVRRILWAMDAVGLLSGAARPAGEIPTTTPAARDIAIAGAVLLKNQGNVLPLGKEDVASLAVIGPTAKLVLVGGGGSANVRPMHSDSPLDVLQRRVGTAARITYAKGYDVDGEVVPADVLRPNATLNFVDKNVLPPGSTLTWTGSIVAPKTGDYVFSVQTGGGRGSLSFTAQTGGAAGGQRGAGGGAGAGIGPGVGSGAGAGGGRGAAAGAGGAAAPAAAAAGAGRGAGAPGGAPAGAGAPGMGAPAGAAPAGLPGGGVMAGFGGAALLPTADGLSNSSTPIRLTAGQSVPLTVTISSGGGRGAAAGPVQARLAWMSPDLQQARIDEAVRAAKAARVAVVFAYDEGTEGRDRASLTLPGYQDALIAAVAAANPRTIVVLNNGAPILMPWADKVAAILQMWYPGQEGADATTAILLGEASPGGRLPVTFPRRAEDAPTFPPERYPGVDGRGAYSEGIFVGYRWYDKEQIEPLFPFGHGLSYTTFAYSGLSVRPAAGKAGGYDVKFTIKNTGTREGTDVPQVYVGSPANPPVPMAVKSLAGFERVTLTPGQSRQVTIHVDPRELSYWSTPDHAWMVAAGRRTFMLGSSSRSIALKTEVTVGAGR